MNLTQYLPMVKKYLPMIIVFLIGLIMAWYLRGLFSPAAAPQAGTAIQQEKPRQYTDATGTVHTDVKVAQVEKSTGNDLFYQHKIDSMATVLDTKNKYIHQLLQANLETGGTFVPYYIDTNGNKLTSNTSKDTIKCIPINTKILFKDQYLDIVGSIHPDSSWRYKITETLTIVSHEKKKGWFGRELTLDISSTNPNTRITGLSSINITPKPKRWGLGFNVGYMYTGTQWTPAIGIGIQRNIIRF